jgi:chromosome segregation ATPase
MSNATLAPATPELDQQIDQARAQVDAIRANATEAERELAGIKAQRAAAERSLEEARADAFLRPGSPAEQEAEARAQEIAGLDERSRALEGVLSTLRRRADAAQTELLELRAEREEVLQAYRRRLSEQELARMRAVAEAKLADAREAQVRYILNLTTGFADACAAIREAARAQQAAENMDTLRLPSRSNAQPVELHDFIRVLCRDMPPVMVEILRHADGFGVIGARDIAEELTKAHAHRFLWRMLPEPSWLAELQGEVSAEAARGEA